MKRRIFWSILLTSFLVLALTVSVVMIAVYHDFETERKAEIKTEAGYIAAAYYDENIEYLRDIGKTSKNRITLIRYDGTVLYDNFADTSVLDNHKNRPEIAEAMESGSGEAQRASDTLGEKTYYYAVRLNNGNILRVASTMRNIAKVFDTSATYIELTLLLALVISIAASDTLTKRIVRPINNIKLDSPLSSYAYDELSPLLVKIDKQNQKITLQMEELKHKQREFSGITDSMNEALIIYGTDKKVLSANRSAKRIFSCYQPQGLGYLEICRDIPYIRAVEDAFLGKSADAKLTKAGRIYRISVNPVNENDNYAAVLFAVDITESEQAEQMRREFSANVSHELKTPLTSILGCAEIMQSGIAKPEDFPHFTEQIYNEAKRLLSLIDDIIKLSRLDESELKNEFSEVDLYKLCEKVIDELAQKAKDSDVALSLKGERLCVKGIENTLHEMIYNLCDNAITYNIKGGSAEVSILNENGHAILSVEDTGIGIAPEHQSRVFERFYRVDKSHSKETGGTGLGLSIVKHGAILHGAEIRLTSTLGKGSVIELIFNNTANK
ncbi:MAG: ATP-binding protein [Oscillospiraceae bacterium]|nr:ATP-binding protein [Oscillospiraceae bacterium]